MNKFDEPRVYFSEEYRKAIAKLTKSSPKLSNAISTATHTDIPLDVFYILSYLTVTLALESQTTKLSLNLGASIVFLPPVFDTLSPLRFKEWLADETYLEFGSTWHYLDSDFRLIDGRQLINRLHQSGQPTYTISPVLDEDGEFVVSIMIIDVNNHRILSYEPRENQYPEHFHLTLQKKHLLHEDFLHDYEMLMMNYVYCNFLLNSLGDMKLKFYEMNRYAIDNFEVIEHLNENQRDSKHFLSFQILYLFMIQMTADAPLPGYQQISEHITTKLASSEYVNEFADFASLLKKMYRDFAKETDKPTSDSNHIMFFDDVLRGSAAYSVPKNQYDERRISALLGGPIDRGFSVHIDSFFPNMRTQHH